MNELMILQHENFGKIRAEVIDGQPWFVSKDVCKALSIENNRQAISRLDADEKGVIISDTPGGKQELTAVNESGIYALIFQSRKPEARRFRKWVTSDVLPSIRKMGRYEVRQNRERRMSRGELVTVDLLNLLWLIGENLNHGDQKAIAMELGVSVQSVSRTLNGYNRSNRILSALYRKAMENRQEHLLYTEPGRMAERLRLSDADGVKLIGAVGRKRGGQYGNSNAKKVKL